MFYPKFIKKNDCIGICAPSKGVGSKLKAFNTSIKRLNESFCVKETDSVRVNNVRSNTALIRGNEFNSLFMDDSVDMVMCASGGDFLFEVLPYIDWKLVCERPKWFMGYSDPTSILYTLTLTFAISFPSVSLAVITAGRFAPVENLLYILTPRLANCGTGSFRINGITPSP